MARQASKRSRAGKQAHAHVAPVPAYVPSLWAIGVKGTRYPIMRALRTVRPKYSQTVAYHVGREVLRRRRWDNMKPEAQFRNQHGRCYIR